MSYHLNFVAQHATIGVRFPQANIQGPGESGERQPQKTRSRKLLNEGRMYWHERSKKLEAQQDLVNAKGESMVFKSVCVYFDGYLGPYSVLALRQKLLLNGGRVAWHSPHRATHIVCYNLANAKRQDVLDGTQRRPVVRPEWIMDSHRAGQLLAVNLYLVYPSQAEILFGAKRSSIKTLLKDITSDARESAVSLDESAFSLLPEYSTTNNDALLAAVPPSLKTQSHSEDDQNNNLVPYLIEDLSSSPQSSFSPSSTSASTSASTSSFASASRVIHSKDIVKNTTLQTIQPPEDSIPTIVSSRFIDPYHPAVQPSTLTTTHRKQKLLQPLSSLRFQPTHTSPSSRHPVSLLSSSPSRHNPPSTPSKCYAPLGSATFPGSSCLIPSSSLFDHSKVPQNTSPRRRDVQVAPHHTLPQPIAPFSSSSSSSLPHSVDLFTLIPKKASQLVQNAARWSLLQDLSARSLNGKRAHRETEDEEEQPEKRVRTLSIKKRTSKKVTSISDLLMVRPCLIPQAHLISCVIHRYH